MFNRGPRQANSLASAPAHRRYIDVCKAHRENVINNGIDERTNGFLAALRTAPSVPRRHWTRA